LLSRIRIGFDNLVLNFFAILSSGLELYITEFNVQDCFSGDSHLRQNCTSCLYLDHSLSSDMKYKPGLNVLYHVIKIKEFV